MLAELKMKLDVDQRDFGYYQSSNMQGVLMEQIAPEYAERLHEQGLKPYSQYIIVGKEEKVWVIKTYTKEAYENIIVPLLDGKFTAYTINKKQMHVTICEKTVRTVQQQALLEEFYSDSYNRYLNLEFLTPTAFKSNGKYMIMPDMRYIYQSLMNKYSAASANMQLYDDDTLEQLTTNSQIVRYRLRSTFFPMEGVKIPAFQGEIGVKVTGTTTMAKYAKLLVRFGEYSGVGIKTSVGMGALKIGKEHLIS